MQNNLLLNLSVRSKWNKFLHPPRNFSFRHDSQKKKRSASFHSWQHLAISIKRHAYIQRFFFLPRFSIEPSSNPPSELRGNVMEEPRLLPLSETSHVPCNSFGCFSRVPRFLVPRGVPFRSGGDRHTCKFCTIPRTGKKSAAALSSRWSGRACRHVRPTTFLLALRDPPFRIRRRFLDFRSELAADRGRINFVRTNL